MAASKMNPKTPVEKHFDEIASKYDSYTKRRSLHYTTLKKLLKDLIPDGERVFEIGCGTGDLIASLEPKFGYGMDISGEMIKRAKIKYKNLKNIIFSTDWPDQQFDYIFMSDVIEHLEKPDKIFEAIEKLMGPKTVFINTMMNPVWEPVEQVYTWLGWKMPEGPHHRIKFPELKMMVEKAGMKIIKHDYDLLLPVNIPFLTKAVNQYLGKPFKKLSFIEYFTASKR